MSDRKYIIVLEYNSMGEEFELPIIFPKQLTHRDVAFRYTAISAGFFFIDKEGKVLAGGKSDSLGIPSRPEDSALIQKYLYPSY